MDIQHPVIGLLTDEKFLSLLLLHSLLFIMPFRECRLQKVEAVDQFLWFLDRLLRLVTCETVNSRGWIALQIRKLQIVGDDEADIKSGKLSVNSPIARGLIGREEGDTVQIDTPGGTKEYEVDKVEHL